MNSTPFSRRRLIAGVGALAAVAASTAVGAAPRTQGKTTPPPQRIIPSAYAIQRSRYTRVGDFVIPKANELTLIPMNSIRYEEGTFSTLLANGMVQVNEQGLYRVVMGLDWKAQEEADIGLRLYGLRRKLAGDLTEPNLKDERLASFDHPGSDSPASARAVVNLQAFTIPAMDLVTVDVTLQTKGTALGVGDVVNASHAAATELALGAAFNYLSVEAKMTGPNTARVIFFNRSQSAITVPAGKVNVLAQSTTDYRGESEDAWNVLGTPLVEMFPGDRVYIIAKNQKVAGDYIQEAKNSTFLQLEKFG